MATLPTGRTRHLVSVSSLGTLAHLLLVLGQVVQADVVDDVSGPDEEGAAVLPQQLEEVLVGRVAQEPVHGT